MNRENAVDTNSGILCSLEEGNPATCHKMDETQGHYAKGNKPVATGQILYV